MIAAKRNKTLHKSILNLLTTSYTSISLILILALYGLISFLYNLTYITLPDVSHSSQTRFHIVISTECNFYNEWQAFLFLYSHKKSNFLPDAKVTRIISCHDSFWRSKFFPVHYYQVLQSMFSNYQEIWTPNYNPYYKTGDDYAPRNRPHSLLHIFNHRSTDFFGPDDDDEEIVILMDPDQLFLSQWSKFDVSEGRPIAAQYSSGIAFLKWANAHCHGACDDVPNPGELQIGAPYVVHARDLKKITPLWVEAMELIRLHNNKEGGWLSDMYGYTIAALRLGIRHRCLQMMVSSADDGREPWQLVDMEDKDPLFVLHYCQNVEIGNYKWSKHDYRDLFHFADCSSQEYTFPTVSNQDLSQIGLSLDTLPDAASAYPKYAGHPDAQGTTLETLKLNRHLWLYQNIIPLANEGLEYLREKMCA